MKEESSGAPRTDPDLEKEAEWRWGESDRYRESARRTSAYGKEQWDAIQAEAKAIYDELAEKMRVGASPDEEEVMALAERHREHIDRWFYPCDHWMQSRLAEMYVFDERFTSFYDNIAPGLAAYLANAIDANALVRAGNVEAEDALAATKAARGMRPAVAAEAKPLDEQVASEPMEAEQTEGATGPRDRYPRDRVP